MSLGLPRVLGWLVVNVWYRFTLFTSMQSSDITRALVRLRVSQNVYELCSSVRMYMNYALVSLRVWQNVYENTHTYKIPFVLFCVPSRFFTQLTNTYFTEADPQ